MKEEIGEFMSARLLIFLDHERALLSQLESATTGVAMLICSCGLEAINSWLNLAGLSLRGGKLLQPVQPVKGEGAMGTFVLARQDRAISQARRHVQASEDDSKFVSQIQVVERLRQHRG